MLLKPVFKTALLIVAILTVVVFTPVAILIAVAGLCLGWVVGGYITQFYQAQMKKEILKLGKVIVDESK